MQVNDLLFQDISNEDFLKLRSDCGLFLKEFSKIPVYRGIRNLNKTLSFHPPVANRKAVNSSKYEDLIFNSMIYAAFNIIDVRKKSIFASLSYNEANYYGDVAYCFPTGDIKYIYSENVQDSYSDNYVFFY